MSKINLEYDTVTKMLTPTQDGKKMENLKWAGFSYYGKNKDDGEEYMMNIECSQYDKENGCEHSYTLRASKNNEFVQKIADYLNKLTKKVK